MMQIEGSGMQHFKRQETQQMQTRQALNLKAKACVEKEGEDIIDT